MVSNQKSKLARWWPLAVIVVLQIIILVISPEERTLGAGIKPVYLHVSLTWTGMLFLALNGLLGLAVLFSGNQRLACWQRNFFLTGLVFYGVGFLISMYASWLNWGGIPWQEPKIRAAVNVMVSGIGAWFLRELIGSDRLKGLIGLIPVAYIAVGSQSPRMVLHPDNPVVSSPLGIKGSFLSLFLLAFLLALWMLWFRSQGAGRCGTEK